MTQATDTDDAIRAWLVGRIAEYLDEPGDEIDTWESLAGYGIDSMHKIQLGRDIEVRYDVELEGDVLRDTTTIDAITAVLRDELTRRDQD